MTTTDTNEQPAPSRPVHELADVETVPISDVQPMPGNPRIGNRPMLQASLDEHGQYKPVIAQRSSGHIIAGNNTWHAAKDAGVETIAVQWLDVDDERARKINLVDNRASDQATYDDRLLAEFLEELPDLDGTGYETGDLDGLLSDIQREDGVAATPPDEQALPEPPRETTTQFGDIWTLGAHRLVCGDATEPATWTAVMDGQTGQLMWTDPPYGVSYVGKTSDALTIENDATGDAELRSLLTSAFTAARNHITAGGTVYCAAPGGPQFLPFAQTLTELEIWRQTLIWNKDRFVLGHSDHHYDYEPVFYGWYPGEGHTWHGGRNKTTTLHYDRPAASELHPTMKPVQLIADCLLNSSNVGDLVVDPFCGSGSTLLAAESTNRQCRGIELSPAYCDVIVWRWQEATGHTAQRNGTDTHIDLTKQDA